MRRIGKRVMMMAMTTAESATTSAIAPHERTDYWTSLIGSYQCSLGFHFPEPASFRGRTSLRRTDSYQLVGWESDAVTYARTPKLIRADPDSDYRLLVPISGALSFRHDDEYGQLAPGSACLVSTDESFAMTMGNGSRGLIITISHEEIRHRLHRGVPPRPLDLTGGIGGVAGAVVNTLYSERAALTDFQFDTVAQQLVDLLCMQILGEPPRAPGHLGQVAETARRYIRAHAADPELTGVRVATALGWSLRQLQLAFNAAGTTPSAVIREQRLLLARDRLRNPAYRNRSIADIASDLGFGSASSFTKAFRRRFDAAPGELRA